MCISFAYQFQKLAHKRNVEAKPYTHLPLWWVSLMFMLGGEVGNFLAYGWAPATVVSPLSIASVVVNELLSHMLLGEKLAWRNCLGVALAVAGACVIALSAPVSILPIEDAAASEGYIYRSLVTWRALVFLLLIAAGATVLGNPLDSPLLVSKEFRARHVWCNCLMCGLLGFITVMSAKGVSTAFLTVSPKASVSSPLTWVSEALGAAGGLGFNGGAGVFDVAVVGLRYVSASRYQVPRFRLKPCALSLCPTPSILCRIDPTLQTLHPSPFNPRPFAIHPAPQTLHPTPRLDPALNVGGDTRQEFVDQDQERLELQPTQVVRSSSQSPDTSLHTASSEGEFSHPFPLLHATPYTLHPAPYTLHPTSYAPYPHALHRKLAPRTSELGCS